MLPTAPVPHPVPDLLADLIAAALPVLGEPMRIKLLDRLRDGAATVQELTEALGASQQNVSKHLGVLPGRGHRRAARRRAPRRATRSSTPACSSLCEQVCGGIQRQARGARADLRRGGGRDEPVGPIGRLGRWTAQHFRAVVGGLGRGGDRPRACSRRASSTRCRAPAGRPPARSRSRRASSSTQLRRALGSYALDGRRALAAQTRRATRPSERRSPTSSATLRAERRA